MAAQHDDAFIADPTDHLIAVIDDTREASMAEQELRSAGFDEVHRYQGEAGAHTIDSTGAEHGLAGEVVRGVQQAFSNKDNLAEYEQALREGASVLALRVNEDEQRDLATDILERHSAHDINHFGKAIVRTIQP